MSKESRNQNWTSWKFTWTDQVRLSVVKNVKYKQSENPNQLILTSLKSFARCHNAIHTINHLYCLELPIIISGFGEVEALFSNITIDWSDKKILAMSNSVCVAGSDLSSPRLNLLFLIHENHCKIIRWNSTKLATETTQKRGKFRNLADRATTHAHGLRSQSPLNSGNIGSAGLRVWLQSRLRKCDTPQHHVHRASTKEEGLETCQAHSNIHAMPKQTRYGASCRCPIIYFLYPSFTTNLSVAQYVISDVCTADVAQ